MENISDFVKIVIAVISAVIIFKLTASILGFLFRLVLAIAILGICAYLFDLLPWFSTTLKINLS